MPRRRAVAAGGGLAARRGCGRPRTRTAGIGGITIAVPMLPRIANFDDFDPLAMEPDVRLVFVRPGEAIRGDADVVILPGTKSTIGDLAFLRAQGWDIDLKAHVRRGGKVLGLCGGYQMLGREISDPDGVDGAAGTVQGLGLLDRDDGDDARQIDGRGVRPPRRDWRRRQRLRNPSRPYRRSGLRAAGSDHRRPAGRRNLPRRSRAGHLCPRAVHVRLLSPGLAR